MGKLPMRKENEFRKRRIAFWASIVTVKMEIDEDIQGILRT